MSKKCKKKKYVQDLLGYGIFPSENNLWGPGKYTSIQHMTFFHHKSKINIESHSIDLALVHHYITALCNIVSDIVLWHLKKYFLKLHSNSSTLRKVIIFF